MNVTFGKDDHFLTERFNRIGTYI
jgi:hypothetical protein